THSWPMSRRDRLRELDDRFGPGTWSKEMVNQLRKGNSRGELDWLLALQLRDWAYRQHDKFWDSQIREQLHVQFYNLSAEVKAKQARSNLALLKAKLPPHFAPLLQDL